MENRIKTVLLLAGMTVFLIVIGRLLGGRSGMYLAFILALGMNFFSYWFSDKIVLKMYGAQEVTPADAPQLHQIVDELAREAGIPKPKVYIIPDDSPNAFATGRNPEHAAVAATEGIMRLLTPAELKGVLAHEIGHVRNRDILISTIAATMAGAIMILADMARFGAIFGMGPGQRRRPRHHRGPGDVHHRPHCGHAHPDGHLPVPGIPGGRNRGAPGPQPRIPGPGPGEALPGGAAGAHGRQPGHGPHVHRQSADGQQPHEPVQHPPAH